MINNGYNEGSSLDKSIKKHKQASSTDADKSDISMDKFLNSNQSFVNSTMTDRQVANGNLENDKNYANNYGGWGS